jgi:hypothetical protein
MLGTIAKQLRTADLHFCFRFELILVPRQKSAPGLSACTGV